MIKNERIAATVLDRFFEASRVLDESVGLIQKECTAEELHVYRRAIGQVLGEIHTALLLPLFREHPELKPKSWG